ncbi:S53 family peptidase [Ktedonospora formicarum]|uniref:Pseudomonapepsin n=1 Tax=Ktedonospora formicarum TaxID=2778364 RepID=A0A8J3HZT5_9CHLR|nr:S53 family peptidase [Ktedonospora formicarum]GHO46739.1 pseudomonapepsin [Ktedonospora formicarum]
MKLTTRKWSLPVTVFTLLLLVSAMVAAQTVGGHLAASASQAPRFTMRGHIAPVLKQYKPMHAANEQQPMNLALSLRLRNEAELDALIAAQNNPNSSLYHHYITPQYFEQRFAPDQQSVQRVASYLRDSGLQVTGISSNSQLINVSGSLSQVEKVFNVAISDYNIDGRTAYAPTSEPSLPAEFSNVVLNVSGLDNVARYHHYSHSTVQSSTSANRGPAGGYTPSTLRSAYNINPLLDAGFNGQGQSVALFELDGYVPGDVNTYLQQYGLGAPRYSNVLVDGAKNKAGSGAPEVELDMEILSAIAPKATQKVYIGPNTAQGALDLYNQIVTDNTSKVVSISWGACERETGQSLASAMDNVFKQGVAQGQAFFAASGDSGAYACDDSQLGVDYPASDPHVVGVGGTKLSVNSDGSYADESAWSDTSSSRRGGGGGGISQYFKRPAYQDGIQTSRYRAVPDISADADLRSGYSVFIQGRWSVIGGTSASAPLWAGIATNINQYLTSQDMPTMGSGHEALYSLFTTPQPYAPYHDVTTGDNLYYGAKKGYDLATGMGTPNAWNIARDLAASNS